MTQAANEQSILDFALYFAREMSWAVFPLHSIFNGACTCGKANCHSPGKHPRTVNGVLDASKDETQIRAWFGPMGFGENANIGIATGTISNLIVVDVDEAKGGSSLDLIVPPLSTPIFETTTVKTGGGQHFYYEYPGSYTVKNSAGRLGKFIDVRGDGGYVVGPPSKHISGKTYEFVSNSPLIDFPREWYDKLQAAPQPAAPAASANQNAAPDAGFYVMPQSNLIVPDSINQGARNFEMTKIAGSLRRIGLNQIEIEAALVQINVRVCQPPLDASEINYIAHSVTRYKPNDDISQIDEASGDYENTLKAYQLDNFFDLEFEEKEILGFHIGKRDIAIIQAATNAGKTTLLRNIALCMAAGRRFHPFYEGARAIKLVYFDFENDAQDCQRDLKVMFDSLTPEEKANVKKNFIVVPKGLMGGELFQFNSHENIANDIILSNDCEFVLVDNVSAAYDLNDENSNAEVTKKVIKPLLKMAYKGNCAFLFAHHYGKGKNELESAGVHAGRGASALQALSRTVINMFGDVSKGEMVTVECAKRKSDGGQNYTEVFRLDPDRWFHHTTIVPPPKKKTAYQAIREFMETIIYPNTISTAEIIEQFENQFQERQIKQAVSELHKDGFIDKPSHGQYSAKQKAAAQSAKVQNFYEKDDENI